MALRGVIEQFVETIKKLTLLQKVSLLAATVAVFAVVVVLILWANKPVYKTLYTDVQEQDLKDVTSALNGKKVPYRVVDSKTGKAIEVPPEDVYETRIALALEGLPKDQGVGFELFDQSKLGETEHAQNVNYLRALQGELARTITTMDEVVQAKVHLSIPKDRIFVADDDDSKASVVIRFKKGVSFRPEQVKAISHLVAAAVRGLKPEAVQIMDTNGNLLSEFMSEDQSALMITQSQLEQQRQMEKEIERTLRTFLATALGIENYVVKANVEMDFNKKEIMKEEFADTPVLRSQHSLDIYAKNMGRGPMGIPGVESNLAEPDLLIDGIFSEYSKSEETQNFEISKTVTHEQKNSGEIKRLTISVIVDDKSELAEQDGVRSIVKRPRSGDELAKIRTAVASAVGFNENRGDIVDVTNISFDTTEDLIDSVSEKKEKYMELASIVAKYASAIVIIILFYLLLIRPILKRLEKAKELDDDMMGESAIDAQLASLDISIGDESGFPKTLEELEREIESELDESVPVNVEAVKSKVMLKKIEEGATEDPEMIANLVKALIKGG
ncbi:MAG: flagellar M-ring protein FliF [Deferribacteraceae bacterium]|jgi:flagellar M-ring protein FliF|nr:flagellar M-ring protein FliF [Deferribacteraceae bacterium]